MGGKFTRVCHCPIRNSSATLSNHSLVSFVNKLPAKTLFFFFFFKSKCLVEITKLLTSLNGLLTCTNQCCIFRFATSFGLAIGMKYFGTSQYRHSVSGLPQIYIYIYIYINFILFDVICITNVILRLKNLYYLILFVC